jgi:hypothetical protein
MGEFAKVANELMESPAWKQKLKEQEAVLHQHIPSSQEEATAKAMAIIDKVREASYAAGQRIRQQKVQDSGIESLLPVRSGSDAPPGRDMTITMPSVPGSKAEPQRKTAEWLDERLLSKNAGIIWDTMVSPVLETAQDAKAYGARLIDEKFTHATRPNSNPTSLPWFYPAAALTGARELKKGYQDASEKAIDSHSAVLDKHLSKAKQEFENALKMEYASSKGLNKASSAGELVDALAQAYTKAAAGELVEMAGPYLGIASLLGYGAHQAAKGYIEDNDPERYKLKELRRMLKARLRASPPPVQVAPPDLAEEAN